MQAEPTLTKPRAQAGWQPGADDGASRASGARVDQTTAFLAPIALIVGLALAGGGFDVSGRHIAGLAVWLFVVALIVLGAASRATIGRPLYWAAGLTGGLAFLSAISSLWSGSMELSVIEADRVLVYLGCFLATFLLVQTDQSRQRFAEGLAAGVTLVALLALGSRLLPHVLDVSDALGTGPRVRYPLGYWNANGEMCGIAIALLLWMSRRSSWRASRWLSVAAMPAVLLTLYFTYSRGGLLSLLVACGCLIVLSRDRLWLLATIGAAAAGAIPAVLAVQSRHSLADNLNVPAAVDQGVTVLLVLLAGTVLTLLLFGAIRRLERRRGPLTGRVLELSRSPLLLRRLALVGALVAIALAIAVGGRAWHQFSRNDIQVPNDAQRFTDFSGTGRQDFWRVALDAFGEEPLLGHGAGTYEFSWEQHRSIDMAVHDAHSLYLESFAELGLVGGLTVLALVGYLLWSGFAAWRDAPPPQREGYAALFAAMLAFAVGAAFDWFWEIADVGAIFFLAGGVLVGVRCVQLSSGATAVGGGDDGRRYGATMVGLAAAWIAAIALIGPLLVDRELHSSQSAAAAGNVGSAVDHAETARSIEPWAASPYVQLGLLAELQGEYSTAAVQLSHAIEREDHNWQLYYLRSRVRREGAEAAGAAGEAQLAARLEAEARADFDHAKRLNPRAPELAVKP